MIDWFRAAICGLVTEDGRKGWAMLAAFGCTVMMSAYAAASLWMVRDHPMFAFWLGLSAQGITLIVVTGLMVLLGVRRNTTVKHGDTEITIDDE